MTVSTAALDAEAAAVAVMLGRAKSARGDGQTELLSHLFDEDDGEDTLASMVEKAVEQRAVQTVKLSKEGYQNMVQKLASVDLAGDVGAGEEEEDLLAVMDGLGDDDY